MIPASGWIGTDVEVDEEILQVPLPEIHVAVYDDSDKGRASFLTTRIGESQLISGFRYFEVFLIVRNTGEFILVDRID